VLASKVTAAGVAEGKLWVVDQDKDVSLIDGNKSNPQTSVFVGGNVWFLGQKLAGTPNRAVYFFRNADLTRIPREDMVATALGFAEKTLWVVNANKQVYFRDGVGWTERTSAFANGNVWFLGQRLAGTPNRTIYFFRNQDLNSIRVSGRWAGRGRCRSGC
jgi:hypothetical protein